MVYKSGTDIKIFRFKAPLQLLSEVQVQNKFYKLALPTIGPIADGADDAAARDVVYNALKTVKPDAYQQQSVTITPDPTAGAEKMTYEFTNLSAGLFSLAGGVAPSAHVNGLLVLQEEENLCEKNTQMLNKCLLLSGT